MARPGIDTSKASKVMVWNIKKIIKL